MISLLLLFIFLIVIIYGIYRFNNCSILSPSILVCASFLLSTFVALIKYGDWKINIKIETVLLILGLLISMVAGEILINKYLEKRKSGTAVGRLLTKYKLQQNFNEITAIRIPLNLMVIIIAFMIGILALYFNFTFNLSVEAGNTDKNVFQMIHYARVAYGASTEYNTDPGILINQGNVFSKCLAYFFVFALFMNYAKHSLKKKDVLYLIPVILYLVQLILSTQRLTMIAFVAYAIFLGIIIYAKTQKNVRLINKQVILIVSGFAVLMFSLFLIYGLFTGKTQRTGPITSIMLYVCGSIYAFDSLVPNVPKSSFFGQNTLRLFYATLGKLGFKVPEYKVISLPQIILGDESERTNVYTAFFRYISDYGYFGAFVIMFLFGIFYSYVFKKVINSDKIGIVTIFAAMIFYPLCLFSIEEYFMRHFFAISLLYDVFHLCLVYLIMKRYIILDNADK